MLGAAKDVCNAAIAAHGANACSTGVLFAGDCTGEGDEWGFASGAYCGLGWNGRWQPCEWVGRGWAFDIIDELR